MFSHGRRNPHLASSRRIDPICLNFGDRLVGVWRVYGYFLEGVCWVSGGCLEGALRMYEMCLNGVWRVSKECPNGICGVWWLDVSESQDS